MPRAYFEERWNRKLRRTLSGVPRTLWIWQKGVHPTTDRSWPSLHVSCVADGSTAWLCETNRPRRPEVQTEARPVSWLARASRALSLPRRIGLVGQSGTLTSELSPPTALTRHSRMLPGRGKSYGELEPCEVKVSRTVLRGLGPGNRPRLPDYARSTLTAAPRDAFGQSCGQLICQFLAERFAHMIPQYVLESLFDNLVMRTIVERL